MNAPARILRVGVVAGNRIIEERLFRRPGPVTVGQAPGNTFVYPLLGFPRSHELLAYSRGTYSLVFPSGLPGKLSTSDDLFDLDELAERGGPRDANGFCRFALTDDTRGRVRLGELTLLFQFVTPPPAVPRLRVPAGAQRTWLQRLDLAWTAYLVASFVLVATPAAYLHAWYDQRGRYLATMGRRSPVIHEELVAPLLARIEPPHAGEPDEPPPDVDDEGPVPTAKPEIAPAPPPGRTTTRREPKAKPEGAPATDPNQKRLEHVREHTLLKWVALDTSPGGQIASGVIAERMADSWNFARGAATAQADDVGEFKGVPRLPGYATRQGGGRSPSAIAVGAVEGASRGREVAVRLKLIGETGDGTGPGRVDKASVAQVFKRRQGALKHCYEQRLKRNAALAGKLRFTFTIGPAGRVTALAFVSDSTGDPEVARCVGQRVREWRFPEPAGGAVTFVHTLVLSPGG